MENLSEEENDELAQTFGANGQVTNATRAWRLMRTEAIDTWDKYNSKNRAAMLES
jgi:hypothetical protein